MQSGATVDTESRSSVEISNLAVYDTDGFTFDLYDFTTFSFYGAGGDYLYGTDNLEGIIKLRSFVRATYVDENHLIATGPGAPYKGVTFEGYPAQTFASLPTIKTAAATDSQSAFVVGL